MIFTFKVFYRALGVTHNCGLTICACYPPSSNVCDLGLAPRDSHTLGAQWGNPIIKVYFPVLCLQTDSKDWYTYQSCHSIDSEYIYCLSDSVFSVFRRSVHLWYIIKFNTQLRLEILKLYFLACRELGENKMN